MTASSYGAAIGDPKRYRDAGAAYRASGLVPVSYESAGRARSHTGISREGSVELRRAIVELGRGVGLHHPDFITYRRQLNSPRETAAGRPNCRRPPCSPARVRNAAQPATIRRRPLGARRRRTPPSHRRAGPSWRNPAFGAHQHDVTCPLNTL